MREFNKIIEPLPPGIRLLYAQLVENCSYPLMATRDVKFIKKQIGNKSYWIRRSQIGQSPREISLGPATRALTKIVNTERERRKENEPEVKSREQLVKALIAGGASTIDPVFARILALVESAGVFTAGGVMIGSHAFLAYGNMLGYKFPVETSQTADVDLGSLDNIEIGVSRERPNLKQIITKSELDFLEVPALDRKAPSTSFIMRGREYKVDILTPMRGATNSKPVLIPSIKSHATPLRFLDYLIEGAVEAVVVGGSGIKVHVPNPGRFAIHKLVVARQRGVSQQIKASKDLKQAGCIFEILATDRPWDIETAMEAAGRVNGTKFTNAVKESFDRLEGLDILSKKALAIIKMLVAGCV